MFSYFEPSFIEKFLWESGFQILAKIEMRRNKNRLFGRHWNGTTFSRIVIFIVHTYKVQISLQNSGGKVVFLRRGSMEPPLGTNGSKKYLGHLSVRETGSCRCNIFR